MTPSRGARQGSRRGPRRPTRTDTAATGWTGQVIELTVERVAHGGHCVGRYEGRVVFVRHALPGERVNARVTEDRGGSFCRADAVDILSASEDRVTPPCQYAGPGRCGGCDWQHATPAAQRELKAAVVREQLTRLAGLPDVPVTVEELPGGPLHWRTRVQFAVGSDGRAGLRPHRRHDVIPIEDCLIAHEGVRVDWVVERKWPVAESVEVAAGADGQRVILVHGHNGRVRRHNGSPVSLVESAGGRSWQVTGGGFWQVHPAAASTLAGCVSSMLSPQPGERVLDLYAGVGLFAGMLADEVGPTGRVLAVESDPRATEDALVNLADLPQAEMRQSRVDPALIEALAAEASEPGPAYDLVVLDPPRSGAGREVAAALAGLGARAIAYVACDPAALARDLAAFAAAGYRLETLRAFDLFPNTHHVECVALLVPA